jgi:hypothetical protein
MPDTSDATFAPQGGNCGPGAVVIAVGVARMGMLKSRALVAWELLGTRFWRSYVGFAFYAQDRVRASRLKVQSPTSHGMGFGTYEGEVIDWHVCIGDIIVRNLRGKRNPSFINQAWPLINPPQRPDP